MTADPHLTHLLGALDLAVFEPSEPDRFRPVAQPPAWFLRAWKVASATEYAAAELARSGFLEHFLTEAASFWAAGQPGRLRSSPWSEWTLDGGDTQFEAGALTSGDRRYLTVERLGLRQDQRQTALQAVRERNYFLEQLIAANEDRFVLLDCIVHDLAGPLQGIKGCLTVLEHDLPDSTHELWRLALRQVAKQEALIDEVLANFGPSVGLTAVASGASEVCDAGACASEVVELLTAAALAMGRTLVLAPSVDPAAELWVRAPGPTLERVIMNLVQNALRHSPLDSVVTVDVRGADGRVRASVQDQGPGVEPDIVPTLFQRRTRGLAFRGRAGLGLFFARRAVESCGGTIGYEPRAEGGALFWFDLPAAPCVERRPSYDLPGDWG